MRPFPMLPAGLLLVCTVSLRAEQVPGPERSYAERGFYKGIVLLSATSGSISGSTGSLLDHDKKFHESLRALNDTGVSPFGRYDPASGAVQPVSSIYLFQPEFRNGNQVQTDLEFGLSSHIGVGITYMSSSIDVRRREQLPLPETLFAGQGVDPRFYTESIPFGRNYYDEKLWMASLTIHPFSGTRVDPYLALRGGAGVMEVAYRKFGDPFDNFFHSTRRATGRAASAALGLNIFLTGEFGIKLEANGTRRFLKSDAFHGEGLNTGAFSVGLFLNWDNISRYSY